MVGLLGRVINSSQGLYLHRTTQHRKTWINIHTLSGIQTHDPSNQPAKTHASDCTATVTGTFPYTTLYSPYHCAICLYYLNLLTGTCWLVIILPWPTMYMWLLLRSAMYMYLYHGLLCTCTSIMAYYVHVPLLWPTMYMYFYYGLLCTCTSIMAYYVHVFLYNAVQIL
jgi:hypothetical protein